ncbi:MAG: hypothetical protein MI747_08825 [Desulfobacterales bacterium]|nr:hypothetical protein [Desulfobacterales bacterium]
MVLKKILLGTLAMGIIAWVPASLNAGTYIYHNEKGEEVLYLPKPAPQQENKKTTAKKYKGPSAGKPTMPPKEKHLSQPPKK